VTNSLRSPDSFYTAIEAAAHGLEFSQKQTLLNEVYERFFQGYSVKILLTMARHCLHPGNRLSISCASAIEVSETEFGNL